VLRCVAVCCSVLNEDSASKAEALGLDGAGVWVMCECVCVYVCVYVCVCVCVCVAARCIVLQCVALCCSV